MIAVQIEGSLREKLLPFALFPSFLAGKFICPATATNMITFLWVSEPSLFGISSGTEDQVPISRCPPGFQHQLKTGRNPVSWTEKLPHFQPSLSTVKTTIDGLFNQYDVIQSNKILFNTHLPYWLCLSREFWLLQCLYTCMYMYARVFYSGDLRNRVPGL